MIRLLVDFNSISLDGTLCARRPKAAGLYEGMKVEACDWDGNVAKAVVRSADDNGRVTLEVTEYVKHDC